MGGKEGAELEAWLGEGEGETIKQVSRANSIKLNRHFSSVHSYHLGKRRW